MPVPRLSQSAEAARAAAAQAEFNEKKWVWVPDEKEGYLAGFVNKEEDDVGEVVMASGGEVRTIHALHCQPICSHSSLDSQSAAVHAQQDEPSQV